MSEKIDQLVQDAINCYNQQDWTEAQKAFEEVLTEDPDNPEANAFLGSILYNLGNTQDALTKFQKAENANPARDYIYGEWGIVLNDWGRALEDIQAYEQ